MERKACGLKLIDSLLNTSYEQIIIIVANIDANDVTIDTVYLGVMILVQHIVSASAIFFLLKLHETIWGDKNFEILIPFLDHETTKLAKSEMSLCGEPVTKILTFGFVLHDTRKNICHKKCMHQIWKPCLWYLSRYNIHRSRIVIERWVKRSKFDHKMCNILSLAVLHECIKYESYMFKNSGSIPRNACVACET